MSITATLLLSALALQVAPTAPTPAPGPAWDVAAETKLAALVDEKAMQATVRELCELGPRMGGTESGNRSAEYLRERFAKLGLEATGGSPADLGARMAQDTARWAPIVKASGFRAD